MQELLLDLEPPRHVDVSTTTTPAAVAATTDSHASATATTAVGCDDEGQQGAEQQRAEQQLCPSLGSRVGALDVHRNAAEVLQELQQERQNGTLAVPVTGLIDWEAMPKECYMLYSAKGAKETSKRGQRKGDAMRIQRKNLQCEGFAAVIRALNLPPGAVVVDMGSGSCGLTLPLAFAFPHLQALLPPQGPPLLACLRSKRLSKH